MMPGMIMLWYGTEATVPSGWHICDGNMGTPNLSNRFVIGASVVYPNNTQGGSGAHVHTIHGDGHAHNLMGGSLIIDSDPAGDFDYGTNISSVTGDTNSKEHRPPWYSLYYIMKL